MKTVGTVDFHFHKWRITCQPHVMIRLKRIFEGVEKSELNTASLSDTLRNAYEIRWFLTLYPMLLSETAQALLDARCDTYEERQKTAHV